MRENIGLYRGKQMGNDEWIEGGIFVGKNTWIVTTDAFGAFKHNFVEPSSVGQYTGMIDMNGNKIFEGDVIQVHDNYGSYLSVKGVVHYHAPRFTIDVKGKYPYSHEIVSSSKFQDMQATITVDYKYEIIGNIHDDPELLEE